MRSRASLLLLITAVVAAAGCGGLRQAAGRQKAANDLKELGVLYHNYHDRFGKPPQRLEDFQEMAGEYPSAVQGLREGRFVFLYGVSLRDMPEGSASTVVAYERDVPANGGLVLLGDGSVRTMTAQEFQSTPKGKPRGK